MKLQDSDKMGCSLHKHIASHSLDNIQDLCCRNSQFTHVEKSKKDLIKQTWMLLEDDMENIGIQVFLRIFDQNPSVKLLFPFKDVWGDALITHPMFKAHANRWAYSFVILIISVIVFTGFFCCIPSKKSSKFTILRDTCPRKRGMVVVCTLWMFTSAKGSRPSCQR